MPSSLHFYVRTLIIDATDFKLIKSFFSVLTFLDLAATTKQAALFSMN